MNGYEMPVKTLEDTIRLVDKCFHGVSITEPCEQCQEFEVRAREMFAPAQEV